MRELTVRERSAVRESTIDAGEDDHRLDTGVGSRFALTSGMDDLKRGILYKAGETSSPLTLTALRIGVGIIMIVHGWAKLGDVSGTQAQMASLGIPAPDLSAWLAIAGELLGGAGLLVGLLTPVAAFGVLATMAVAIGYVHAGNGLLAKDGGFEYPLTMGLVALFFMTRGAGPLSLDTLIERRASEPRTSRDRTTGTGTPSPVPGT